MSDLSLQEQLEAALAEEAEVTDERGAQQAPPERALPPPAKRRRLALQPAAGEGQPRCSSIGQTQPWEVLQQKSSRPQQGGQQQLPSEASLGGTRGSDPRQHELGHTGDTAGAERCGADPRCPLLELSEMLLTKVLAQLSPEDLLVAAQACRQLNAAASDAALWRRLYISRWPDGPQSDDAEHVQGATWRRVYLERDAQAVLEARAAAPSEELLPIYLQMATARRSEALSPADAAALFRSPASSNRSVALASKVEAYRRQHSLTDAAGHAAHRCGKAGGCRWAQLDSTAWICERSGFVHVCDANCTFRELDHTAEGYVCQVSGRCFPAEMLTEREEHAGEEERGRGGGGRGGEPAEGDEEDWAAEEGVSGRLGRAFVAGYNAQTPEAFFRKFGVRW
ncbi:hypothetical protein ABPG77_001327 [Micractinium sp. CCAP 211/92]